jgi:diguanylate cyclase (GGDEF)-like protein
VKSSSDSKHRILLAEDEDLLRWSIQRFFEKRGFTVEGVKNGTEGIGKARVGSYDLLITDLSLGGVDGLELAAACRAHNPELQTIVITGYGSKESAIAALRQGVWDYVEKPLDLQRLLFTVEKALDKRRMERELVRLSRTDGLTGLYNQRYFYEVLKAEMRRAQRQNHPISLILLDVDNFKEYNDLYGHLEGDEMLARVALCLKKACRRDVDMAFRYGGDEFILVLPGAGEPSARNVANRIVQLLEEESVELSLSIGINEIERGSEMRAAMREADEAMYTAKQFDGNKTVTFRRPG